MTSTHAATAATPRRPMEGFLRNVTSGWAGILISIGLSFVLAPLTVNALGTVHYGLWTLLMQFTGYLWLFDFGVRESVVKYVAQYHASDDHESVASTVNTAVSIYSVVAIVAMLAVCGLAIALPYVFNIPPGEIRTARITALITGATVAQTFVFNVFVGVLMGLQKFYVMARLGMFFALARSVLIYWLLTHGYGIIALAWVQLATVLSSNLIVWYLAMRSLPYLSVRLVRPHKETALRLLNYGKYVLIANVGDKIVFATDSIVIGMFLPISALTFFAIGGALIEQFRTFIASMGVLFNPLSSSMAARKEKSELAQVFMTGTKGAMLLGLPVCIGFMLLGETFISLWMGPEFGPQAGRVLTVLAAGYLIGLPYYTISGVLYGLGEHRIVAFSRIFEGAVNLGLSVVLVMKYGLVGVAVGTAVPHAIVVGVILPWIMPRLLPVNLREYYTWTYARPLLAAVPFAMVCWAIGHIMRPADLRTFLGAVTVGLTAYAVPCWAMAMSAPERDHVRRRLRQRLQPASA